VDTAGEPRPAAACTTGSHNAEDSTSRSRLDLNNCSLEVVERVSQSRSILKQEEKTAEQAPPATASSPLAEI